MNKQQIVALLRDLREEIDQSPHGDPGWAVKIAVLSEEVASLPDDREERFRDHYVAAFLAAYKASTFSALCMRKGGHDELRNHGIVEDAEHLAEFAWKAMLELSPRFKGRT